MFSQASVCSQGRGVGYVSSDDHQVSLAKGVGNFQGEGWVCLGGGYVQGSRVGYVWVVGYVRGVDIPGQVPWYTHPTPGPPPLLTTSGGHKNMYNWLAGSTHPTGMLSCFPEWRELTPIWNVFTRCKYWPRLALNRYTKHSTLILLSDLFFNCLVHHLIPKKASCMNNTVCANLPKW